MPEYWTIYRNSETYSLFVLRIFGVATTDCARTIPTGPVCFSNFKKQSKIETGNFFLFIITYGIDGI